MKDRLRDMIAHIVSKADDTRTFEDIIADELIANGVIVPPCKIGDALYIVENPYTFLPLKKVTEGIVISIHQHEHGLFVRVLFDTKKINGCVDYNLDWRLNKNVFLTREEAEKALERSENGT